MRVETFLMLQETKLIGCGSIRWLRQINCQPQQKAPMLGKKKWEKGAWLSRPYYRERLLNGQLQLFV